MKYLLILYGVFKDDLRQLKEINNGLSIISNISRVKYTYTDNMSVYNFFTSLDDDDVCIYVDELIKDQNQLYLLIPYILPIHSSMSSEIHNFLFDESDEVNTFKPKTNQTKNISLDSILDKIYDEGLDSLTNTEKIFLEKHSK